MKTLILGLIAMLALGNATAFASNTSAAAFVQKAQSDLIGQYALATLAKTHASTPAIRSLAAEVAAQSSAQSRFLDRYAKAHGITLTSKPGFRADAQYSEMSGMKGAAFDRRFAQDIYADSQIQSGDFDPSDAGSATLRRFAQHETTELNKIGQQAHKLGG